MLPDLVDVPVPSGECQPVPALANEFIGELIGKPKLRAIAIDPPSAPNDHSVEESLGLHENIQRVFASPLGLVRSTRDSVKRLRHASLVGCRAGPHERLDRHAARPTHPGVRPVDLPTSPTSGTLQRGGHASNCVERGLRGAGRARTHVPTRSVGVLLDEFLVCPAHHRVEIGVGSVHACRHL